MSEAPPQTFASTPQVVAKGAQQAGRTGRATAAVAGVTVGGRYRGTNAMRYYKWVEQ